MFALTLALGIAVAQPPVDTTRFELNLQGSVYGTSQNGVGAGGLSVTQLEQAGGGLQLQGSYYLFHGLVDDDAPLSLQPFLQRSSTLTLTMEGGSSTLSTTAPQSTVLQTWLSTSRTTASIDAYVNDHLVLLGSLGVGTYVERITQSSFFYGAASHFDVALLVGIGVRVRDFRLDLRYQVDPVGEAGQWITGFLGGFSLAGEIVIARHLRISQSMALISNGGSVSVGAALYPTKKLGLTLALSVIYQQNLIVFGGVGGNFDSSTVAAQLGISYWLTRELAVALTYAPSESTGPFNGITQEAWLNLVARPH